MPFATVGFHVLTRTGHMDLLDTFWLRLNNVLHTSGHLNYQELYLFYAFFRSIVPPVVVKDLYLNKPGAMVTRIPSFTAGLGSAYDTRGWNYLHLDEILEMLIIRLLKGLNTTMLQYLETSGAWLLTALTARLTIRSVTAATRSYHCTRQEDSTGQESGPLQVYGRSAVQSNTVYAMVQLMRSKGFLRIEHMSSEKLQNVLGDRIEELNDDKVQKLIIDADNYGKKSAELHASAMLPDVFGRLSDADFKEHFDGKRFRGQWTKQRQIPTAGTLMASKIGVSSLNEVNVSKDTKKILSDRRHAVTKLMTTLTLAEHAAIEGADLEEGAETTRKRWNVLHGARHVMSPFADAYRSSDSGVKHAQKSQILSALNLEAMEDIEDPGQTARRNDVDRRRNVSFYYDYHKPSYASVMVDLMNHIWSRGTDGRRGNSLHQVTVLKLKHMLRPWLTGRRSRNLKQLHLHIDDPSCVIPQKRGEQARRDSSRAGGSPTKLTGDEKLYGLGLLQPITVPWTTLVSSRESHDAICTLHLFCGAVAAIELSKESDLNVKVFLQGGCFCFLSSCIGISPEDLVPELAMRRDICESTRDGEVLLTSADVSCANAARGTESVGQLEQKSVGLVLESGASMLDALGSEGSSERMTRENGSGGYGGELDRDIVLRVPRERVLSVSKEGGLQISSKLMSQTQRVRD